MIEINNHTYGYRIARAAGAGYDRDQDTNIARVEGGELWGGVVYTGFTGVAVATHVAGFRPDWINRDMLWLMFDYPFNQLSVGKIICWIPENAKVLDFVKRLGFSEETRVKAVFPQGDAIVMSILRDDYQFRSLGSR